MISISSFNYFGLSVTRVLSATARSTIDTCRTCLIVCGPLSLFLPTFRRTRLTPTNPSPLLFPFAQWAASLFLGWEHLFFPSSAVQLAGFALLVYNTLLFNGIVHPPNFIAPPPGVELSEEDLRASLDETARVPSEGPVGRVGYEVLPRLEEGGGAGRR